MNKKIFAVLVFSLLFVIPLGASAAASMTPGTTTTVFGIPVTESFRGLTADTAYEVRCTSSSNDTTAFTSDSDGEGTVTITPPAYGQNVMVLCLAAGGSDVLNFTIDNMDIMPYIIILITISILFGVLKTFTGKGGGLF